MGRPKGSKNKTQKTPEPKKLKLTVTRIICVKCGEKKTTTKPAMEKLISLFGSIEEVHEKYHCMKCRKEHNVRKDGKPKPEKRKRQPKLQLEKTEDGKYIMPHWMIGSPDRTSKICTPETLYRPNDGPVCHRSDIKLKDGNCNACILFEFCNCTTKEKVEKVAETKKGRKKLVKEDV